MNAFAIGWRRLGPGLAMLALASVVVALGAAHTLGPAGADPATRAEGDALWLHLPGLALAAVFPGWLASLWPPIGRDRPAAQAVRRLARGPLDGSGAVLAGGALALVLSLAGAGALWTAAMGWTGRPLPEPSPTSAIRFDLRAAYPGQPRTGTLDEPRPVRAIGLRVTYIAGSGQPLRSRIALRAGGRPLHPEPIDVDVVGDIVQLEFAPRTIAEVELDVLEGAPLVVRGGQAIARGPAAGSTAIGGALAATTYTPLALCGAAAIVLLRRRIGLALARLLGLATVAVGALLDASGATAAMSDLGAGARIDLMTCWHAAWPPLAVAAAVLATAIAADLVGRARIGRSARTEAG